MSEQINKAIAWARALCTGISDTPGLDAEILLAFCIGKPRSYLYTWPENLLSAHDWQRFQTLVHQRLEPTPIAYLIGEREFFSLSLKASPQALVPRPETELLVETALALCQGLSDISLLELGSGTGAIAIALKANCPKASITATDISPACLELATENSVRHRLDIDWLLSDWFAEIDRKFDFIVSNPPYISALDPALTRGDLPAEPILALSPGHTGLEALEAIIKEAPAYLNPGGYLLLEHGYNQEQEVAKLMRDHKFVNVDCKYDLNKLPRVSLGQSGEP